MTKQMEVIKDMASDSFWSGVLAAIIAPILLKIIWAFVSFVKWIFTDYSNIRKDNIIIKAALLEIKEKLGIK